MSKRDLSSSQPVRTGKQASWNDWTVSKAVKDGYKVSGWVYRCVQTTAQAVSQAPMYVVNEKGEPEHGHPISILLANPNPQFTRKQFIEIIVSWLELSGNAYLKGVEAGGKVTELWPVSPDRIAPIPSRESGELISGYEYTDKDGAKVRSEEYTPENTTHLMYPDPSNPILGIGPLQVAAKTVDTDVSMQNWNYSTMDNKGVVDGVISFKTDVDNTQATSVKQRFIAMFKGKKEPLVLGNGGAYTRLSLTPDEMDFLNSRVHNMNEMISIFGLPPQLLGSQESATYNNFLSSVRVGWNMKFIPVLDILVDQFNHAFAEQLGDKLRIAYDLSGIAGLSERENEKAETAKLYFEMGVPVKNLNDKFSLGLTEFPKWDQPFTGKNTQTVEQRSWGLIPAEQRSAQDEADRRDEIADGPFADEIADDLTVQQVAVFDAIDKKKDPLEALAEVSSGLADTLTTGAEAIAEEFAGTVIVGERGQKPKFNRRALDPEAKVLIDAYLDEETLILEDVSLINATTVDKIVELSAHAVENGLSASALQQSIIDSGIFSPERALRISRTVAGTAMSVGQLAGGVAGGATHKTWLANPDARQAHQERNETTVKIDGRFARKLDSTVGPRFPGDPEISASDRINCSCFLSLSIQ